MCCLYCTTDMGLVLGKSTAVLLVQKLCKEGNNQDRKKKFRLTSRTPMPWQSDFNCCSVVLAARFSIDIVLVLGTTGCWATTSGCWGGITFTATTDRPYMFTTVLTIIPTSCNRSFLTLIILNAKSDRILELMWWQQQWNCRNFDAPSRPVW
jgi:hypothetical protein